VFFNKLPAGGIESDFIGSHQRFYGQGDRDQSCLASDFDAYINNSA